MTKRLKTALTEAGMSTEEYDDLVSQYATLDLALFWSHVKGHWVVEQIGGCSTYTHFKTQNMAHLRQVDVVKREFDEVAQPAAPQEAGE